MERCRHLEQLRAALGGVLTSVGQARPSPALLLVVLLGGAIGGLLRWSTGQLVPDDGGFPQTTFAINLVGSGVLALLPALPAVRRSTLLTAALGPGLLGGFTTLSTASEQTRALLDAGEVALALVYLVGSLGACLAGVALVRRLTRGPTPAEVTA